MLHQNHHLLTMIYVIMLLVYVNRNVMTKRTNHQGLMNVSLDQCVILSKLERKENHTFVINRSVT